MEEPDNNHRAERALHACREYTSLGAGDDWDADPRSVIVDLIADLLHLADREGFCAESVIGTAQMHYEAEVEEG